MRDRVGKDHLSTCVSPYVLYVHAFFFFFCQVVILVASVLRSVLPDFVSLTARSSGARVCASNFSLSPSILWELRMMDFA